MVNPLEDTFPRLASGNYRVTSPASQAYNCIAWAVRDTANWWWPDPPETKENFWPANVSRLETVSAFHDAFASAGYGDCAGEKLEAGFEKIALFASEHGVPLHAARQLSSGRWTSKIGELEDIEHALHDLEGDAYGSVVLVMKRSAKEDQEVPQ